MEGNSTDPGFVTQQDWYKESFLLRFCFLDRLILVNDFGLLNAERRDVWLKWLTPKYPKHKVVMV